MALEDVPEQELSTEKTLLDQHRLPKRVRTRSCSGSRASAPMMSWNCGPVHGHRQCASLGAHIAKLKVSMAEGCRITSHIDSQNMPAPTVPPGAAEAMAGETEMRAQHDTTPDPKDAARAALRALPRKPNAKAKAAHGDGDFRVAADNGTLAPEFCQDSAGNGRGLLFHSGHVRRVPLRPSFLRSVAGLLEEDGDGRETWQCEPLAAVKSGGVSSWRRCGDEEAFLTAETASAWQVRA